MPAPWQTKLEMNAPGEQATEITRQYLVSLFSSESLLLQQVHNLSAANKASSCSSVSSAASLISEGNIQIQCANT